ncbi:hypothetical protein [Stieleria neptunia]|nr:hypothetical protein [Stieleria neptunia]
MKPLPPNSYDEWLLMPESDQDHLKFQVWDAYERDRVDIPYTALARLIASTERTVVEGAVGTYHCGEYLLHVHVPKSEIDLCPRPLAQRFEGFRVYWMYHPASDYGTNWDFELKEVLLDVLGNQLFLNAKRRDYRLSVEVLDSAGTPLVVSCAGPYDNGFVFNLADLHPDLDTTHRLMPTKSGEWQHEYTVYRVLR